jgi:hypothetical protein
LENTPDEPININVGDRTVFRASPLIQRGNLAVQVAQIA